MYPNRGRVTVWRDGVKIDSFASVNGTFNGAWANDTAGSYGSGLTGATVSPLSISSISCGTSVCSGRSP